MTENKKDEVEVLEKVGTCDSDLFEKMAKKGDITATSIKEFVGKVMTVLGYSRCKITTDEKEFEIGYYDTDEYGFVSTGSEILYWTNPPSTTSVIIDVTTLLLETVTFVPTSTTLFCASASTLLLISSF